MIMHGEEVFTGHHYPTITVYSAAVVCDQSIKRSGKRSGAGPQKADEL